MNVRKIGTHPILRVGQASRLSWEEIGTTSHPMNVSQALMLARRMFEKACVEDPARDAEILLSHILNRSRFDFLIRPDDEIEEDSAELFDNAIEKRCSHMPVAYIMRETEFMSLSFTVNEQVMIPRPETEVLVEKALSKLGAGATVIDLGTGSGNIAVSLAKYCSCLILATDVAEEAVETAKKNAFNNGVDQYVTFLAGDMFDPIMNNEPWRKFDLLVSNPPYVSHDDIRSLPREIRDFEPDIAFDGGEDGLRFYRIIARHCRNFLKPGGHVAVEVGYNQARSVCQIFKNYFKCIEVIKDYAGIDRVIIGQTQE